MYTATATVNGMTCGHCARAVTRAIQQRDPEAIVQVDLLQKQVQIAGDLSEQDIRAAIVEAGYEPMAIQRSAPTVGGAAALDSP